MMIRFFFLVAIAALLPACGGNTHDPTPDKNANDRKLILEYWVDHIVVPSYASFEEAFEGMKNKANAFTTSPALNTLAEFRDHWIDAYISWQRVELFEFGAADRNTLRNFFNIYPADVAGIAANIDNPMVSLEVPSAYPRQGFPALDYLINGVGADDAAIVAFYTDPTSGAARMAYLNRLVTRMETLLNTVVDEWSANRDTFVQQTGLDIGSSMGLVVNAYVLHYERYIRTGKVGIPSGSTLMDTGTPYPEKVEAYYQRDISRTLALNAHTAAVNFFNGISPVDGTTGPSFSSYLDAIDAKDVTTGTPLSTLINDQFAVIAEKLNLLDPDFTQQIQADNAKMTTVHTEMQALVRMLKVDMTSAMSITITYTDNDGD